MSILVTGALGKIGISTVQLLLQQGEQVVGVDNRSSAMARHLPKGVPLCEFDVREHSKLREVVKTYQVQSIVHLAGCTSVAGAASSIDNCYENNFNSIRTVLGVAYESNLKNIVVASSAAVYGNTPLAPIRETETTSPLSPYGRSKLAMEYFVEDYCKSMGLNYIIFRYFNVAGCSLDDMRLYADPVTRIKNVIERACDSVVSGSPFTILGSDYCTKDGTCVRDFVHVSEVGKGNHLATQYLRRGGESCTLNLGSGTGLSILDLIADLEIVTGKSVEVRLEERREDDIAFSIACTESLEGTLNWKPRRVPISVCFREYLQGLPVAV